MASNVIKSLGGSGSRPWARAHSSHSIRNVRVDEPDIAEHLLGGRRRSLRDEESVPLFQQFAGGDPPDGDDVRALSAVASAS